MIKKICILILLLSLPIFLFAQNTSNSGGKEIENLVSAVKAANPGDYILLRSGKKYILTKEEIAIANGLFDYGDLSGAASETLEDGTQVITISEAHTAYRYSDGQSTHILKTSTSFTSFMDYVEEQYHITRFVDYYRDLHDSRPIGSPRFNVFRASVQFKTVSNGIEELEAIDVTAYNFKGQNFVMKFCSKPDMVWGHISDEGSYRPTGESRQIEFDIE